MSFFNASSALPGVFPTGGRRMIFSHYYNRFLSLFRFIPRGNFSSPYNRQETAKMPLHA
jgi:hypothetical protein